jgi:CheY-like chemotaxis protein
LAESRPLRILVAEDNQTNRDVFALMLERFGYAPTMVEDGELAVECATREDFDLVLMDLHMPNLDGIEAAKRILERRGDRPRPRIVALTADVRPEQRKACLDAGMSDFLGKPIRIGELERVLRENQAMRDASASLRESDEAALGRLRTLCANRPGAFERLVAQHVAESRTLVDAMRASAQRGDAEALRAAAHRLKSSTALFGEMDVSRFAETLERLDSAARPDAAARLIDDLERAARRAASRLAGDAIAS